MPRFSYLSYSVYGASQIRPRVCAVHADKNSLTCTHQYLLYQSEVIWFRRLYNELIFIGYRELCLNISRRLWQTLLTAPSTGLLAKRCWFLSGGLFIKVLVYWHFYSHLFWKKNGLVIFRLNSDLKVWNENSSLTLCVLLSRTFLISSSSSPVID